MRIRENWLSLRSWRGLASSFNEVERSQSHLSAGLRIRTAADDASGLSISHKILGQFQGLNRASRNALDGISLVNTAEGALGEVHTLLQRGRVLGLYAANGTLTTADRQSLQLEMDHILTEINRIFDVTAFNNKPLFTASANSSAIAATIYGLRSSWFTQAEDIISQFYGLNGNNSSLSVVFEDTSAQAAWITGDTGPGGILENIELHINLSNFGSAGGADGGSFPFYNDRKVARVLAQAVIANNVNYSSLPDWFLSGAGDLIAGRDEQLLVDLNTYGGANVVNAIDSWTEDDLHQSSAYLAVKYLNSLLAPFAMSDLMFELSNGNDLSASLLNTLGMDLPTFINDFKTNGEAFAATLDLDNSDVGGIGGGDASGVIPNVDNYTEDPLTSFEVTWPDLDLDPLEFVLQVGANYQDQLSVLIPQLSTYGLGLLGIDLVTRPIDAIPLFDEALRVISNTRSQLGATTNRLNHLINANDKNAETQLSSYTRIVDLDYAHELTNLTRNHILLKTSSAMMAQANTVRQHILWLLKDLPVRGLGAQPSATGGNQNKGTPGTFQSPSFGTA